MSKKKQAAPQPKPAAPLIEQPLATPAALPKMRWMGVFFFLMAFLLYAPTIGHQYAFDDSIVIVDNKFTQKGIAGIPDLLTRDFFEGIYEEGMNLTGGRYRPLSLLMFALEYQFFGLNPAVGHFINVLLYALTALLLFRVLARWFGRESLVTLLATLLFVVHPIHTEVVANIKSRDEILALLLLLGTFQALHRYTEHRKPLWMGLAALAFFGAMLSKESAFTFVVVIPLTLWALEKRTGKEAVSLSMPLWIAAFAYIALRTAMVGGGSDQPQTDLLENPLYGTDMGTRLGTVAVIVLHYWRLLFLPHPLSCDYSFDQIPRVGMGDPFALISIALHISLLAYVLWRLPKKEVLPWALIAVFAPLSPALNLFFNVGAPMGERFLYISSLGFSVGMAFLIQKATRWEKVESLFRQPLAVGAVLLVAGGLAVLSFQRSKDWYNNETLFTADVKTVPNSAKVHYYYGNTILKKYLALPAAEQEKQKAKLLGICETEFKRAVEIYPDFHTAMYNVGLVYYNKPEPQKALEYWEKTLQLMPRHIITLQMMAELYARYLNNPDKSLEYSRKLTEEAKITNSASIWQTTAIAYSMKGDATNAEIYMKKALDLEPNNKTMWQNMAAIYAQLGQMDKANAAAAKAK